jgi:hypothetical protein
MMRRKHPLVRARQRRALCLEISSLIESLEARELLSAAPLSAIAGLSFEPTLVNNGRVSAPEPTGSSASAMANGASPNVVAPINPAQMRTAYGVNLVSFGPVAGTGAGQTIAIIDAYNDPNIIADATAFNQQFGLQAFNVAGGPTLHVVNQNGGTSLPVNAGGSGWDLEESLDVEWAHSIAPQANIVLYEANSSGFSDLFTAIQTAAAAPGVSAVSMSFGSSEFSQQALFDSVFTTPSGHSGVTFLASTGDSAAPGDYPAFSSNVVAVGGTSLNINSGGNYVSESAWSDGGGGISQVESQPAYQQGKVNGTSSTRRTVPDVSMDADPNTGVYVLDSYEGGWFQVGGTSLSSPMWAGLVSIADQGLALQGDPALDGRTQTLPILYNLPSTDFHDVTAGNNGYPATPGYDLATGLGSPVANLLIPDIVSRYPTFSAPPVVDVSGLIVFSTSNGDPISLTDGFADSGVNQITLNVSDGSLSLAPGSGVTVVGGINNSSSITIDGTIAQLDGALNGLTYSASGGFQGTDHLRISFVDTTGGGDLDGSTTITLTVGDPAPEAPTITSASAATFTIGTNDTFSLTATGFPTPAFGETGALPGGVTFNTSTGVLSGVAQPGTAGIYNITFTADNGIGTPATQNFTLDVSQTPTITSANNTFFTVGSDGSFTVTAAGYPSPSLNESGRLPAGVTFDTSTDALSGIPAEGTAGTYVVTFTASNGTNPSANQTFTLHVNPAPAAELAFIATPTTGTAGHALSTAVKVAVKDQFGTIVTGDNSIVSLTLDSGLFGGSVTTVSAQAVHGIATFTNLAIDTAGHHTLTASDGFLAGATSGTININPGAANKLVFLQSPSNTTAGQALSPWLQVLVEDAFGNLVTASRAAVTLSIHSGPANFAAGHTVTSTALSGVATFSNLVVHTAGNYTLTAASGSLLHGTSSMFNVAAASADKLVFTKMATTGSAGTPLGPLVTVAVEDAFGNVIAGDGSTISINVHSGPGGFDGGSSTSIAANSGIATFGSLVLDTAGKYTLSASDGALVGATSATITVNPSAASQLVLLQSPSAGTAGQMLAPALRVAIEDAFGNVVTTNKSRVSASVQSGPAGFAGTSTTGVNAVNGVATFSMLMLNATGAYTLGFGDGLLPAVQTGSVSVNSAAASKLVFSETPATGVAGNTLSPSVTVAVEDRFGNVVAGNSSMITLGVHTGPAGFGPGSTTSTAALNGVAAFSNLILNAAGKYTLVASDGSLPRVLSGSVTVGAASGISTQSPQTPSPSGPSAGGTASSNLISAVGAYNATNVAGFPASAGADFDVAALDSYFSNDFTAAGRWDSPDNG